MKRICEMSNEREHICKGKVKKYQMIFESFIKCKHITTDTPVAIIKFPHVWCEGFSNFMRRAGFLVLERK